MPRHESGSRLNGNETLSWSQRLAAFQTTALIGWRNQSAKWAHSLRSDFPGLQFPEQVGDEGQPSAQPLTERSKNGFHRYTFALSPNCLGAVTLQRKRPEWSRNASHFTSLPINDDTPRWMPLSRIAHIYSKELKVTPNNQTICPITDELHKDILDH
jgi:hypothetical protein